MISFLSCSPEGKTILYKITTYELQRMMNNDRFGGITRLYGIQEAEIITNAHICVVGIGGVGSWAAEALARSGIGQITIIDHDDIAESNINRQIHSLTETIDQSKVETMAERIKQINPLCQCNIVDDL